MEEDKKKGNETIIKCAKCGFKYYEGDAHDCKPVRDPEFIGVVNVEEKEEEEEKRTEEVTPIPKVEKKGKY